MILRFENLRQSFYPYIAPLVNSSTAICETFFRQDRPERFWRPGRSVYSGESGRVSESSPFRLPASAVIARPAIISR